MYPATLTRRRERRAEFLMFVATGAQEPREQGPGTDALPGRLQASLRLLKQPQLSAAR